jgi:tRNA threonylcarbamoyladenosine biosynthesis protein TsaB
MDARMGEVYAAHFTAEDGLAVPCDDEQVCHPHQFRPLGDDSWCAAGTGWRTYADTLSPNFADKIEIHDADCYPLAASIIKLARKKVDEGALLAADKAFPVYLRDNVAKKKGEQS